MEPASWPNLRAAVEETATRFTRMLGVVEDPTAPAIGDWTIADTAAHVLVIAQVDGHVVADLPLSSTLAPLRDRALDSSGIADVAELNATSLRAETERRPSVLGDRITSALDVCLRRLDDGDGDTAVTWLGGLALPRSAVVAHLLGELLIHGRDIARAASLPWAVPSADAAMVFDVFLGPALQRLLDEGGGAPSPHAKGARDVTAELGPDGCRPVTIVNSAGTLSVDGPSAGPVDVRITGDPAVLLLTMFARINPIAPLLSGRLRIGGRRPWRLARLRRAMPMP